MSAIMSTVRGRIANVACRKPPVYLAIYPPKSLAAPLSSLEVAVLAASGDMAAHKNIRRKAIALSFAAPGILLALAAKPLTLGDGVMFLGLLLAFGVPVIWLIVSNP